MKENVCLNDDYQFQSSYNDLAEYQKELLEDLKQI